ncbi:hypothetical protein [Solimicrobium silvestre]|uniref:Uncharacterized protein n=1 Tax=Solimicrobium silvestre TaxID=2099400 RepID=A0A2S9GY36_9BURK|nr:hypothetical protein [Solimicrobium silvestre]PRC92637.1 hypothetical protein S2091_2692 [Solimicrobium silvestre]
MKNNTIHKLKIIAAGALIGSVLTGTFLGWVALPFDLHVIGAAIGGVVGAVQSHLA